MTTCKNELTKCQQLGYKVGDVFTVISKNYFYSIGDKIVLEEDDGTSCPYFVSPKHNNKIAIYLHHIEKIEEKNNKYSRNAKGVDIDIYDVLVAWKVECPATQHAIKKLLMPGQRGSKDKLQDLKEAEQSIKRAIELNN